MIVVGLIGEDDVTCRPVGLADSGEAGAARQGVLCRAPVSASRSPSGQMKEPEWVFIRFQSPTPNRRGVHIGIFGLTNTLAHRGELTDTKYGIWRAGNDWFNYAYPDPTATDATVYDRDLNPQAVAWFKASVTHLLERVPPYLQILAAHRVACERVEALEPGRVIYEDDVQVVVVPTGSPAAV